MYIFLTVCWWIALAVWIVFLIKNMRENGKYELHAWVAAAYMLIIQLWKRML